MRLAIIADVHGNVLALEAVIADIARRGVDHTINLGDCASGPLWPRETIDLLAGLALPTVRGNHDRWVAEKPRAQMSPSDAFAFDALSPDQRTALGALPAHYGALEGVLGFHGKPDDDNAYLLDDVAEGQLVLSSCRSIGARLAGHDAGLFLCAHSHLPRVVHTPNGRLVVNPGSVGCPAYSDPTPPVHISQVGSPHARYALLDRRKGGWSVELVAVEYDWDRASKRASENGRADWAQGLATGFLR